MRFSSGGSEQGLLRDKLGGLASGRKEHSVGVEWKVDWMVVETWVGRSLKGDERRKKDSSKMVVATMRALVEWDGCCEGQEAMVWPDSSLEKWKKEVAMVNKRVW